MCGCSEPKALVPEGVPCGDYPNNLTKTKYMLSVMKAYTEGKVVQFLSKASNNGTWTDIPNPVWNWEALNYRIKQIEGLPRIDWSKVPKELNYFAVDKSGQQFFYSDKPRKGHETWLGSTAYAHAYGIPYSCYWDESLVQRPN